MKASDYHKERRWWKENLENADPKDIVISKDKVHCSKPMEEYTGNRFVDWTHRCVVCKAMQGCA